MSAAVCISKARSTYMTSWKKRLKQALRPDFAETMDNELEILTARYRELGINRQIDYGKFCLYSIITHSTAIEGSTITELENQIPERALKSRT